MTGVIGHCGDKEHFDDMGRELCDDKNSGAL